METEKRTFPGLWVVEHDRFGGGAVFVWAGISYDGRTDLYVIRNGALTGVRYRDETLHPIVRPYAGACGPGFIMMDDNARPHRARVVDQYLEQEGIERMDWPARSPQSHRTRLGHASTHDIRSRSPT